MTNKNLEGVIIFYGAKSIKSTHSTTIELFIVQV